MKTHGFGAQGTDMFCFTSSFNLQEEKGAIMQLVRIFNTFGVIFALICIPSLKWFESHHFPFLVIK